MKSHVAVYKTHEEAFKAVQALSEKKFPMDHVSLIGKADIVDDHIHVRNIENYKLIPLLISIAGGVAFGLLITYNLISIPGMTITDSTGFFVTVFWGTSMGLVLGALLTIITAILFPKERIIRFSEHTLPKRFLVIVNGSEEEIKMAQKILHTEGQFRSVA